MNSFKLTPFFLAPLALSAQTTKDVRPNVIFILADDLGYGDLSCFGQDKFQTPNIDQLALNGMRCTHAYSGSTVSAPSRACLLTGMHSGHAPIRGNYEIQPEGQFPMPADTYTIFHLFKNAGYATGVFGKWGLGIPGSTGAPNNQAVDEFFGYVCQRQAHKYYPGHLWHNNQKVEFPENADGNRGMFAPDLIHEHALAFIDEHKSESFFMYVPITLPHAELLVPEDSIIQKFRGEFPEKPFAGIPSSYSAQEHPNATYAAMVARIDMQVGQIVEKLKAEGIYENTLIIFTSDNGPHREGGNNPDFFNSNGIYRGMKRDLYEGGIRVPTVVSWKNHIPAGTETPFTFAFWDYLPTFAEILGVPAPENTDGISVLPTLLGKCGQKAHDYFYYEFLELNGRQAVIKDNWKLLHLNIRTQNPVYELYHIAADPSENHNLISLYPEKAEELKTIMQNARTEDANWKLF